MNIDEIQARITEIREQTLSPEFEALSEKEQGELRKEHDDLVIQFNSLNSKY